MLRKKLFRIAKQLLLLKHEKDDRGENMRESARIGGEREA